MKLAAYRVTDFRSVKDSGWIEVADATALIGENESGKTNVLLPLWKLNPASDGAVDNLTDMPRAKFTQFDALDPKPIFITAVFELSDADVADFSKALGNVDPATLRKVEVQRRYGADRTISFPDAPAVSFTTVGPLRAQLQKAVGQLQAADPGTPQADVLAEIQGLLERLQPHTDTISLPSAGVRSWFEPIAHASLQDVDLEALSTEARTAIENATKTISPADVAVIRDRVLTQMPKFIYYSSYGNLDSRIYLPHVIQNLAREAELGPREAAVARTLRVLFEFVQLSATQIRDLGTEPQPGQVAPDQVDALARQKDERQIRLSSAATDLTREFKQWWQRGDYRFRFTVDGNFFRIWVSDDRRPEEIELESRSSGLQWFFSFFLVFLNARRKGHANAILLLDEPGVTLHPLAQEDLFRFFEGLARDNQLIYTSHSPFLVDPDHLSDVRVVYVDDEGYTRASSDLRASDGDPSRSKAIYAVDSALKLAVSKTTFRYALPVIVEGPSDQIYLTIAKDQLIAAKAIAPTRELIFAPAGGARAIKTLASILAANPPYPPVLVDGDDPGRQIAEHLRNDLYAGNAQRVLEMDEFTDLEGSEIEDLMPSPWIIAAFDRLFQAPNETEFGASHQAGAPIVPQMRAFAETNGIVLPVFWKMDLARRVARTALSTSPDYPAAATQRWQRLFERMLAD